MLEFLNKFLASGPFIPHGHCYLWQLDLVWLHLISDALIALAYYSIPVTLVYFVNKRQDLPFNWIFVLFGIFIIACGTTHIMEIWTLWHPTYWLSGFIKAITAAASVYTALMLVTLIPQALALPSPTQWEGANRVLQEQILERQWAEVALKQANDELEIRVEKRTAELSKANEQLRGEIVERKRAEEELRESEERLQAILDNCTALIYLKNTQGQFIIINHSCEKLFRINREEVKGKTDYDLFPEEMANVYRANDQRVLEAKAALESEEVAPQDDGLHTYLSIKFPLYDAAGGAYAVCGISTDITERKRMEENIRNALNKEKELGELKSRFVTMTSHEFRTPLSTILSSAELLEHYSHKWAEEKKLNHLQRIQAAVKQMTGLLNDVLLIGKAEAGKLEFKPTPLDLAKFCGDLVEEMQLTAGTHTIAFRIHEQCTNACMDEKLLRHILSNLLSNAIKYSPQGSTVHFALICKQGEAIFHIQDQGIGIPAADQEQLFNSFHRASNVGTISGTGLGLAIVKRALDLHGGQIVVTSEVGVGTTFTATLPLNKQI